jgi:flagellar hook-associated protein 2
MNDIMGNYSSPSGAGSRAIRNLEDSIRRNNEQVTRMQNRMFAEEDRLFRQFAAMETAMSRMQSQGDWFTAMLGGR